MAKQCKDFTFNNKRLSNFGNYITVDFDNGDAEKNLGLSREMEMGSTNTYRVEANYYGDKWSDVLQFEIHLMKNPCVYTDQKDMEITKGEIRQIARWLTSPHKPQWIKFEYEDEDEIVKNYKGWFNNIETWVVGGTIYGLRLFVSCTTPFGYTDDLVNEINVETYKNTIVTNDSDELESFCYPKVTIEPKYNTEVYMCNLSDCEVLENGTLTLSSSTYFETLLDVVENYAFLNGYKLRYAGNLEDTVVALCNDTVVQFYLTDKYNNETKCSAFYLEDTKQYWILVGGFMFMEVKKNLNVYMDCQRLIITDLIGRMVTYDDLGISDVDNMYWLRLKSGYNTILLYGNAKFTITHRESRKVGE